jgi:hypothetical protein
MDQRAGQYAVCRMDHLPAKQELFKIIFYDIKLTGLIKSLFTEQLPGCAGKQKIKNKKS